MWRVRNAFALSGRSREADAMFFSMQTCTAGRQNEVGLAFADPQKQDEKKKDLRRFDIFLAVSPYHIPPQVRLPSYRALRLGRLAMLPFRAVSYLRAETWARPNTATTQPIISAMKSVSRQPGRAAL
jgi:hypothetical protein